MPINRSVISSQNIIDVKDVAITMMPTRPVIDSVVPRGVPNTLLGYYDFIEDVVELYIRDVSGYRIIRIR